MMPPHRGYLAGHKRCAQSAEWSQTVERPPPATNTAHAQPDGIFSFFKPHSGGMRRQQTGGKPHAARRLDFSQKCIVLIVLRIVYLCEEKKENPQRIPLNAYSLGISLCFQPTIRCAWKMSGIPMAAYPCAQPRPSFLLSFFNLLDKICLTFFIVGRRRFCGNWRLSMDFAHAITHRFDFIPPSLSCLAFGWLCGRCLQCPQFVGR